MTILTTTQIGIRQTARTFVAEHIIPRAMEFDASGEFPDYLLDAASESRIFAMAIPSKQGGLGYDAVTQALVLEEWGYGCAGMGTTLAASILSIDAVLTAGTDDQQRRYFKPLLNGEIAAFALTEPGAGSDVGAGTTTAVRTDDFYLINGTKCWISNGGKAAVYVVFALTDPAAGAKGLSAFMIERGAPGLTVGTADHKLGIRSSNTVELLFRNLRVPLADRLGQEGDGMRIAMRTLDMARPAIAALAVGLSQRCLDECVAHIKHLFVGPARAGQSLQFRLADMQIQIEAARQALHQAMALRDAGAPFATESAIAKTLASDVAMDVTSQALSLMGSHGYTSEFGKFMRDAKIMQIYEGTNQVQRLVIGRALLSPARTVPQPAVAS